MGLTPLVPELVTLHVWGVPTARIPQAVAAMARDRRPVAQAPGRTFHKLLGTGDGRTFTIRDADPRHWALLVCWSDARAAASAVSYVTSPGHAEPLDSASVRIVADRRTSGCRARVLEASSLLNCRSGLRRVPGRSHRPAGARPTSDRARPLAASSSPTHPPRELPITCTRSSPSSSSSVATVLASRPGVAGSVRGSGALAPWPGRSTDTTSYLRESACISGSQVVRAEPRPCTSSRGSPDPLRS